MTERPAELRSSAGLFFDIAMYDFRDFRLPCCHRIHSRIDDLSRSTSGHSDTRSEASSWHSLHHSVHHASSGYDLPRMRLPKGQTMRIADQLSFSGELWSAWA